MRIQEIMTREVDLVSPTTSIREAAQRMRADDVGALPVGENDRLIGMVTDRDIAIRAVADGADINGPVREVMSKDIFWCFEDDDLDQAAEAMAQHQVRRLPVLNRDKRLVGIISLADLARCHSAAENIALEGVSQPSAEARLH